MDDNTLSFEDLLDQKPRVNWKFPQGFSMQQYPAESTNVIRHFPNEDHSHITDLIFPPMENLEIADIKVQRDIDDNAGIDEWLNMDEIFNITENENESSFYLHENSCVLDYSTPTTGGCDNDTKDTPNVKMEDNLEPTTANKEWARYLTTIEDIVTDSVTTDHGHTNPLETIQISLTNPLETNCSNLQNRLLNAFDLNKFATITQTPLMLPKEIALSKSMNTDKSTFQQNNLALYLIPLCDVVSRYHPLGICKEFVSTLMNQPKHLNKLSDEIRLRPNQTEAITVPFYPKLIDAEPVAQAELSLKQKLSNLLNDHNIEVPTIKWANKKRPRKICPVIIGSATNKRPSFLQKNNEIVIALIDTAMGAKSQSNKTKQNNQSKKNFQVEKRRSIRIMNVA